VDAVHANTGTLLTKGEVSEPGTLGGVVLAAGGGMGVNRFV
jgi:hypothetical protein